jgi:hypothetical protein
MTRSLEPKIKPPISIILLSLINIQYSCALCYWCFFASLLRNMRIRRASSKLASRARTTKIITAAPKAMPIWQKVADTSCLQPCKTIHIKIDTSTKVEKTQ